MKRTYPKDLTGMKFGKLLVKRQVADRISASGNRSEMWECECDCGKTTTVYRGSLITGGTKSCGCLSVETLRNRSITHGKSKTKLYRVWHSMMNRCFRPTVEAYERYGGRGITVCEEWSNSENGFENFYSWAIANGYKENERLTIDRIDNDGNYEPNNCRIADYYTQANNTRKNVYLEYNGERRTISEWARIVNIKPSRIYKRIKSNWSIEKALTTPPKQQRREAI